MRVALILLALFDCCPPPSQLLRLGQADAPVRSGHYPAPLHILGGADPFVAGSAALRQDIEAHREILSRAVRERLPEKPPLEFTFSYAALDSAASCLMIRYFAPNPRPDSIAGWQVLFAYRLPRLRLAGAWVSAVPLE